MKLTGRNAAAAAMLSVSWLIVATIAWSDEAIEWEAKTLDVNGTRLHYIEHGTGPLLVLVHGSFGDLYSFRGQIDEFAKHFRVIAYSRRFHWPNDPPHPGDTYDLQTQKEDLAALIQKLGDGRAHIVAHSYGAYIALAFALENPEAICKLVVGEPPLMPLLERTSVGTSILKSINARIYARSRAAFEEGRPEDGLRCFLDAVRGTGFYDGLPPSKQKNLIENVAPEFGLEMLTDRSKKVPPLAWDKLAQLNRPVMLLTGEQSPAFLLLIASELERCLEGECHVMVPDAGHAMMSENGDFYSRAIIEFLK